MNDLHQEALYHRLASVLIAFFVLAALSLMAVYVVDPSIYTKTLLLGPTQVGSYPLPATLLLVGILAFIAIVILGVVRHWRWLFWLILVAFGFSILNIPTTILQLTGVIHSDLPVWYSLYRMCIAVAQVVIAIWMVRIYYHYGVWAMGKLHAKGGMSEPHSSP